MCSCPQSLIHTHIHKWSWTLHCRNVSSSCLQSCWQRGQELQTSGPVRYTGSNSYDWSENHDFLDVGPHLPFAGDNRVRGSTLPPPPHTHTHTHYLTGLLVFVCLLLINWLYHFHHLSHSAQPSATCVRRRRRRNNQWDAAPGGTCLPPAGTCCLSTTWLSLCASPRTLTGQTTEGYVDKPNQADPMDGQGRVCLCVCGGWGVGGMWVRGHKRTSPTGGWDWA